MGPGQNTPKFSAERGETAVVIETSLGAVKFALLSGASTTPRTGIARPDVSYEWVSDPPC